MPIMMMPDGMPGFVDPNSTLGLRMEGWCGAALGKAREANPYSKSHPRSLAETHWFEGWDAHAKASLQTAEGQK